MSFDPAFRFYTVDPQARDWWMVPDADIVAEARAELADRRALYPGLVAKGRMTADAAEREVRVMAAILAYFSPSAERQQPVPPSTWSERVHALRREIGLRRTLYPRWVAAGRITQADADRKLALFETMHEAMWTYPGEEARAARAETEARGRERKAA